MSDHALKIESGYTLVETLVALVIFLSVLIPIGFGISSYLFDTKAEELREALLLAEEKMSKREYQVSDETIEGRYTVRSEIALSGRLVEYRVTVVRTANPSSPLVVLCKMVHTAP